MPVSRLDYQLKTCFSPTLDMTDVQSGIFANALTSGEEGETSGKKRKHCPHLTDEQKIRVLILRERGLSYEKIAKDIGSTNATVCRLIQKYEKTKTIARKPGSGRPRKTTEATDRLILRQVKADPRLTVREIKENLNNVGIDLSETTIRKRIWESGLSGRRSRKVPLISPANRQKRLDFAYKYKDKPKEWWRNVIFSDESPFKLMSSNDNQYVWRLPGQEHNPRYTKPTVKYSGRIMVWGCFSYWGQGSLEVISGIMDAAKYKDILENNLEQSAVKMGLQGQFIFQQDNDPKHKSKLLKSYFESKKISLLDHPPQSPDLNPIENLWSQLNRLVKKSQRRSIKTFTPALIDTWNSIGLQYMRDLVDSIPSRLQKVIENKGYATGY